MLLQDTEHRDAALVSDLVAVWERSVRATHTFLTDAEINRIKQYVPQAIAEVPELVVMYPTATARTRRPLRSWESPTDGSKCCSSTPIIVDTASASNCSNTASPITTSANSL